MYINIDNLTKFYRDQCVLSQISCSFEKGKIHGITGRNGSGKTVLLRCICGYSRPTEGKVSIQGKVVGKDMEFPESMGLLLEVPGFLPAFTAKENLQMLMDIRHRHLPEKNELICDALKLVGLDPSSRKKVGKYSLGMKQRLGIAQAVMEQPELLILDEPFNGLDSDGVATIRQVIKELREKQATILLTSHYSEDITALCDTVTHLDGGKITAAQSG